MKIDSSFKLDTPAWLDRHGHALVAAMLHHKLVKCPEWYIEELLVRYEYTRYCICDTFLPPEGDALDMGFNCTTVHRCHHCLLVILHCCQWWVVCAC